MREHDFILSDAAHAAIGICVTIVATYGLWKLAAWLIGV